MSPVRMGRGAVKSVSAAELGARTTELSMALVSGADQLDPTQVQLARRVVDKAVERSGIGGEHTVVALAGATGSGKSSLFNALVGADVATIGARRPTTSRPTAGIWGDADASELLDWLGVVLMLVTFASTAGITGAEVGIAGGTAVVGQKLLEAVFGDQAVRELARKARELLTTRVDELYAVELARYEGAVSTLQVDTDQTDRLAAAAAAVEDAR